MYMLLYQLQISNEASSSVRIMADETKQAHSDLQRDLVSSFQKSLNEKADKQHRHAVQVIMKLKCLTTVSKFRYIAYLYLSSCVLSGCRKFDIFAQ